MYLEAMKPAASRPMIRQKARSLCRLFRRGVLVPGGTGSRLSEGCSIIRQRKIREVSRKTGMHQVAVQPRISGAGKGTVWGDPGI